MRYEAQETDAEYDMRQHALYWARENKRAAAEEMYAALIKMMALVRTLDTNNGDDSWSHETDPDYLEAQAAIDKAEGK